MSILKVNSILPASGSSVSITGLTLGGTGIVSGSSQIATEISGSSTSLSSSIASRVTTEENNVDVLQSHQGNIHAFTSSADGEITALMDFTGSAARRSAISGSITTFSSSIATRVTTEENNVDVLQAHQGNIHAFTASADSEITALMGATSSYAAKTAISGAFTSTSASIASDIASNVSNISSIGSFTASLDSDITTFSLPSSTTISTFGKSLVDDADASAARTTLGLGTVATLNSIDISTNTNLAVSDTTGQTGIDLTLSNDTLSGVVSGLGTGASPTFSGLTVSNDVTINGDLTVLGDATELQVSSLNVEDINITIASGAADSSAANGAGITIAGANESLTWDHGNSRFTFSDDLNVGGNITLTGTVDGRDIASDGGKLDGIEAGADVTDTANVTAAGALMDSEVDADIKTLSLPASTTISTFGKSLVDDADAATARSTLGVDAAGTDNSTDVTLVTTSHDYLSLAGQAITLGTVDISDDTNLAASTGITLTGDTLTTNDGQIVHDNLSGFVANEHIDHSTVSITAGNGLTGGGTIAATRTLNIGAGTGISVAADAISTNDGQIVHDNLSGFVADEHIAHSGVTLTAGDGLTGGGTIAASRTFAVGAGTLIDVTADAVNVDLSELSTSTTNGDGDYFVVVDTSNAQRKLTKANINISGFNNDSGFTTNVGDITGVTAGNGLTGGGSSGTVTVNVVAGTGISVAADSVSTNDSQIVHDNLSGFVANEHIDHSTVSITAGNGLTGGGTIAATRTLNIGAGTGITVAADAISIGQDVATSANVHFEGLMIGQTTGATANTIRCVGDIVAFYSSDKKFKDNIVPLEGALDKVKAIRGVRFDWNDKQDVHEGHDIGVIAQEVEAVLPELVHYREYNDSKAVDYVKLTAVLLEAVKELSAKVDELSK